MSVSPMRIAILADIHGNLPALEAVAEDLRRRGPDRVYVAGDLINRCPWSNEVLDFVDAAGWPALMGNHELVIQKLGTPDSPEKFQDRERFADLWWTHDRLTAAHLDELAGLPYVIWIVEAGLPAIYMTHGVPGNPFVGFSPGMSDATMMQYMADIDAPVVIGAHTHRPLDRQLPGQRVLNPGSVGMPYNGDPRAQYLVLDGADRQWSATFCQVAYDRGVVRRAFVEQGLFDAYGPLGRLYLLTIETGEPWVSDFTYWMNERTDDPGLAQAVSLYLDTHGPGRWAFAPE